MKLISYSLFNGGAERFEMAYYIRGFYLNLRMNLHIYPDWRTHVELDQATFEKYHPLFEWLRDNALLSFNVNPDVNVPLCKGMLWRFKPCFMVDVSHILCRDADSITTYREALIVQRWLEAGLPVLALNDNRAHSGLMGGMVGFNTAYLKAVTGSHSFEQLIGNWQLQERGSDQDWMNQYLSPKIENDVMLRTREAIPDDYDVRPLPQVNPFLWESNLCTRHIGAAGFNEMEVLRFLKRFDEYNWKYQDIEKTYPSLFYWHL